MDRAADYGSVGWGFESLWAHRIVGQAVRCDEKQRVAWISFSWAVLLTLAKLIAGFISGSIGVISEAAHSGLDLVAAGMTVFAVRRSSRPADADHHFGHGKYENLSALFETLLLFVTSAYILWEAVERLRSSTVPEQSVFALVVMLASIIVNIERSRTLRRVAKAQGSQALLADAVHFEADAVTSLAVLVGLFASALGVGWADPVAAFVVALVIVASATRLLRQTFDALLDRAPSGVREQVLERILSVPGVLDAGDVRVRPQGSTLHVDAVVRASGQETLADAHALAGRVEHAVREAFPDADVNVHMEPGPVESAGADGPKHEGRVEPAPPRIRRTSR